MKDNDFLNNLRTLLQRNNLPVGDIELTSGNYDDKGRLIKEEIPTITTALCEIGIFYNKICYLTLVLSSDSFSKKLFQAVKDIEGAHIYGFKNFLEDYFPSNLSFEEIDSKIKNENLFQIQVNFDIEKANPEDIFINYRELKSLFNKIDANVVNQLTQDLRQ